MDYLWTPWRMAYLKGDLPPTTNECIFCAKATTDDDSVEHILYRGEYCFVALNRFPYNNGHLMVIPYRHVGDLSELAADARDELMAITQGALRVLRAAYNPEGFNIGINLGSAAGAGIAEHLHQHIVPRWSGDTNYMTVVGHTRVIPEWIDEMYGHLKPLWEQHYPAGND